MKYFILLGSFKCFRQREKTSASTRWKCFGTLIRRLEILQFWYFEIISGTITFILQIPCFLNENIWEEIYTYFKTLH